MAASSQIGAGAGRVSDAVFRIVRWMVFALAAVAGTGVVAMMVVTCLDVILRIVTSVDWLRGALDRFEVVGQASRWLLAGEVDLVQIAGAIAIACALPYTTAVKGHVAIEYFFHKLGRRGRIAVDAVARLIAMALMGVLAWQSVAYGMALGRSGTVTPTLQIPIFWIPYVIAFACAVVVLVIFYNLLHPGREMIKP